MSGKQTLHFSYCNVKIMNSREEKSTRLKQNYQAIFCVQELSYYTYNRAKNSLVCYS